MQITRNTSGQSAVSKQDTTIGRQPCRSAGFRLAVMLSALVPLTIGMSAVRASMIAGYDIIQTSGGYSSLPPIPGGVPEVSATPMTATTPPLANHTIPNHFRFNNWLPIVATNRYFTTTLTIDAGSELLLTDMTYSVEDLPQAGDRSTFHVRSSLDGFAADIDAFTLTIPGQVTDRATDLSTLGPVTGAIEFRFYATTNAGGNTMGFANHLPGGSGQGLPDVGRNIRINGNVRPVPEPASLGLIVFGAGVVILQRRR